MVMLGCWDVGRLGCWDVWICGAFCAQLRVYTAANIRSELETAKNDYLRAAVGITQNDVVLLPKMLDW